VVNSFEDIMKFPHFAGRMAARRAARGLGAGAFKGKPFNIFETGGTTGMPKQRIGWNDYKVDYEEFSDKISTTSISRAAARGSWSAPTGPRRLRLAIEHLANVRGSSCYFIDLDPRFVKKLISNKQFDVAASTWRTSWIRPRSF
jgi:hypothetical protein